MNKSTLLLGLCLAFAPMAGAQTLNKQGGISSQTLQKIVKAQESAPVNKALFNALAANKIDDLEALINDCYPDGLDSVTSLNDLLWFDSDWVLSNLGLADDDDDDEEEE